MIPQLLLAEASSRTHLHTILERSALGFHRHANPKSPRSHENLLLDMQHAYAHRSTSTRTHFSASLHGSVSRKITAYCIAKFDFSDWFYIITGQVLAIHVVTCFSRFQYVVKNQHNSLVSLVLIARTRLISTPN